MRLLLIEGIPGTGKTTLAKELCRRSKLEGIDTRWYLEEATDHPVHPKSLVEDHQDSDFASSCLLRWLHFAETAIADDVLHIMEGRAFQMTVRFMMQTDQPGISEYFDEFSEIVAGLEPGFIYLRPSNARENSRFVANLRGKQWADKVSRGETSTPFAARNGVQGIEGMHELWEMYAKLCDSLFDQWKHPKKQICFKHGDYKRHFDEAMSFVEKRYRFTSPLSEAG